MNTFGKWSITQVTYKYVVNCDVDDNGNGLTEPHYIYLDASGAGTNLKGGTPVRYESGGTDLARSVGKKFCWCAPPPFRL